MNKNIKRAAIGIIAGGAVVAGGAWYVCAGNVVDGAKSLIDTVNAKPRTDGSSIKITYDSLSRTMFPKVGVRLVNPVIEVNSPGIPDTATGLEASAAAPEPFHITWKHDGTIDIITDRLGKEYRLVNDGSGTGSLESGSDKVSIKSEPSHSELSLEAKDAAAFGQWQALNLSDPDAVKKALSQVGGAHVTAGAFKLTDAGTGATIMTQDAAKFDLANRSDDKNIKFDVAFLSKGSEVTKEYSDVMTHVLKMLHLPTGAIDGSMPMSASRAGKQDIDIDISANLPLPSGGLPSTNGDIHVKKLSIKNGFYQLNAPLDVVLDEDAARRHATIKLNWSLDITPAGAQEMQLLIDSGLPMASAMMPAAKNIDPALLKQKITAALPTVSTLGPISLVLDVDASVPKPAAPGTPAPAADAKQETVTLRAFSFGHKRWGIDAHGEAYSNDVTRGSTVNGTLTCKQCTTLTQDIFETVRSAQEVIALVQPGGAPFPLSEAMLTQLNSTLAEIGKPGTATGDLDFVVTTPAAKDIRLNDKPIGEAMPKLMMVFMQQPPAGAPAPVAPAPAQPQATPGAPAI